ncbi:hypothetical protein Ddc_21523 [Ditylenchus destructor]|nr:hypothetical protein Ddc_21523 [Ditylenchus destructor]
MATHIVYSSLALPYQLYEVLWWSPNNNVYDSVVLFVLGMFPMNYLLSTPVMVLSLVLDRLLVVKFNMSYNDNLRRIYSIVCMIVFFLVYSGGTYVYLIELPLQDRTCLVYSCLAVKYKLMCQTYFKLAAGFVNIFCNCLFFLFTYKSKVNIKNRVVKISLVVELLFNILPMITFNIPISDYAGPYATMFNTMDAAICGVFYSYIFLRRMKCGSEKIFKTPTLH